MSYPVRPLHPDVRLSTGRKVRHYYASNGSQLAVIEPGINAFSEAELAEYQALRMPSALELARLARRVQ